MFGIFYVWNDFEALKTSAAAAIFGHHLFVCNLNRINCISFYAKLHSWESSGKPQRRRIKCLMRFSNKAVESHFLDWQRCLMLVCKTIMRTSTVLSKCWLEPWLKMWRLVLVLCFIFFCCCFLIFSESHIFPTCNKDFLCLFFPGVIPPSIFQIQVFPELSHIIFCSP